MKKTVIAAIVVAMVIVLAAMAYAFYPREERYIPPPTVVAASPTGYGASTSAQISVGFNVLMDTASVESAFVISPNVQGAFAWSRTTMTFAPTQPLPESTYFTVTIGGNARDAKGTPLDCGSYSWSFSTAELPTTRRDIGLGTNDFWTLYPASHPSVGQEVSHPDWVVSALSQGVVLIFDHSEGCYPCVQQSEICESIYSSHPELRYFDLLSGADEPSSTQSFEAYDPNGGVHYVPLTIVVTKATDEYGNEVIAWHSWEGVVDLVTLTSWIQDAQSFYDESA